MIEFKKGAVCYAYGKQWFVRDNKDNDLISWNSTGFASSSNVIIRQDFQLNEIRTGDYISAPELDTEQKYNDAVEVFGLFGFARYEGAEFGEYASPMIVVDEDGDFISCEHGDEDCKRKITYSQLMAIGKLKRAMIECEKSNSPEIPQNEKRNKSKQAYEILKSLDYDYDLVKQKWFKKHYI